MTAGENARIERALGYAFQSGLLTLALTHPSCSAEENNQRLEFLGDAVLQLLVSRRLYDQYPQRTEGELTRARISKVREEALCHAARQLGLGEALMMGEGEVHSGGREKASILADTLEAVLAAVFLDGGLEAANAACEVIYPLLEHAPGPHDYKTELQERLQAQGQDLPEYSLMSSEGPPHARVFNVQVCLRGKRFGKGSGASKKEAQQHAAKQTIVMMFGEEDE